MFGLREACLAKSRTPLGQPGATGRKIRLHRTLLVLWSCRTCEARTHLALGRIALDGNPDERSLSRMRRGFPYRGHSRRTPRCRWATGHLVGAPGVNPVRVDAFPRTVLHEDLLGKSLENVLIWCGWCRDHSFDVAIENDLWIAVANAFSGTHD